MLDTSWNKTPGADIQLDDEVYSDLKKVKKNSPSLTKQQQIPYCGFYVRTERGKRYLLTPPTSDSDEQEVEEDEPILLS
jgi:hypothetical protein